MILECSSPRHLTDQGNAGARSLPPLVYSVHAIYSVAYPPEEIFAYDYPSTIYTWCSGTGTSNVNVTINMTEPVVLYGLLSGGYRSSSSSTLMTEEYVTSFSLKTAVDGGDLVPYQHQDVTMVYIILSGSVSLLFFFQVFQVPPYPVSVLILPEPIVAKIFNFHILSYEGSSVIRGACWTLALMGCRLSEG